MITKSNGRQKKLIPLKIHGDYYSFDIAEYEYISQIALTHSNVKDKGLN